MPAGRPRKEIDQTEFEKLCGIQATLEEIAGWFNCSCETIRRWCQSTYEEQFCEVYEKKSADGKISLRRSQMRLAETNAAMAIWLGKQYLGQKEPKQELGLVAEIENLDTLATMLNGND